MLWDAWMTHYGFRGMDKDGTWRYGDLLRLKDWGGKQYYRIFSGRARPSGPDLFPEYFDVAPKTIGQYSGVSDKNNVWIYEGDIISGAKNFPTVCIFHDGAFCLLYKVDHADHFEPINSFSSAQLKVIGNVFENMDILDQ